MGFISVVINLNKNHDLSKVVDFLVHISLEASDYEVIICQGVNNFEFEELKKITRSHPNTSAYELMGNDLDANSAHGLGLALGDWVIELTDSSNYISHFDLLHKTISQSLQNEIQSIVLVSEKVNIRDKVLLLMSKFLMHQKIYTFQRSSRATSRQSLLGWNRRAFKSKVLRIAPAIGNPVMHTKSVVIPVEAQYYNAKLFRIGIRNIVYSSITPLRVISGSALIAAFFSSGYSAYVLMVRYQETSAPGWASTNLILSLTSLITFSVLYVICEYLYQLVGTVVQGFSIGVSNESLNKNYSFIDKMNIEDSKK